MKAEDQEELAGARLVSFQVHQASRRHLWGRTFEATLSALAVVADPAVDGVLFQHLVAGPPVSSIRPGGDCTLDVIAGQKIDQPVDIKARSAQINGWAMLSSRPYVPNRGLRVAVTSEDGTTLYAPAVKTPRPDVDRYFGIGSPGRDGFAADVALGDLHGSFTLRVVQDGLDGPLVCEQAGTILH